MKIQKILKLISKSCVVVVSAVNENPFTGTNDSPLLRDVRIAPVTGDPGNEVLRAEWVDGNGQMFAVKFNEHGMVQARIEGNKITLPDYEGDETEIQLFQPLAIKE